MPLRLVGGWNRRFTRIHLLVGKPTKAVAHPKRLERGASAVSAKDEKPRQSLTMIANFYGFIHFEEVLKRII
jgi:hypothetical protein